MLRTHTIGHFVRLRHHRHCERPRSKNARGANKLSKVLGAIGLTSLAILGGMPRRVAAESGAAEAVAAEAVIGPALLSSGLRSPALVPREIEQPEEVWPILRPAEVPLSVVPGGLGRAMYQDSLKLIRKMKHGTATPQAPPLDRSGERRLHLQQPGQLQPGQQELDSPNPVRMLSASDRQRRQEQRTPTHSEEDLQNHRRFQHQLSLANNRLQIRGETSLASQMELEIDDTQKSTYEIRLRRALVRSPQQEFALSLGFQYLDEETLAPPGGVPPLPPLQPSSRSPGLTPTRPTPPNPLTFSTAITTPAGTPVQPAAAQVALRAAPSATSPPTRQSEQSEQLSSAPSPLPPAPAFPSEQRTSVIQFGQDYTHRDNAGMWKVSSRLDVGTGLLDATAASGNRADGQFWGWGGRIERSQQLNRDHRLTIRLNSQLTGDRLLTPHKFKVGKAPKIPGFRSRGVEGDSGIQLMVEDRMTVLRHRFDSSPLLQLAPLMEVGYVWSQPSETTQPGPVRASSHFLATAGFGLFLTPTPQSRLGINLRMPVLYKNSLGETEAEEGLSTTFSYQARW